MMRKLLGMTLLILLSISLSAQSIPLLPRYFVFLKDKDLQQSPEAEFSPAALARRAKLGLAFPMFEDFPVTPDYVAQISQLVSETRHALRWFNAVSVAATAEQIVQLKQLPFVAEVVPFDALEMQLAAEEQGILENEKTEDTLKLKRLFENQGKLVQLEAIEKAGLSGKGVCVAVFDAGFSGADTHIAFQHLRQNAQILKTQDFVSKDDNVYGSSNHGTAVLSCITGFYEGHRLGAANQATFLLARTERNLREPISEEDNWMAAAEWADLNGADIISSSLGYTKRRYDYSDMTGEQTIVARAAAIAVRKGILVVNSAGNEGSNTFHYIGTPADADSVLTVGGSYPMVAYRMPFSSFGPNARGVLKPEICGPGYMLAANKKGGYKPIGGTSFACPMIAGLAACMMERWPEATNMEIKQKMMEAGSTYPYFDYGLGYGVFQADRALNPPLSAVASTFEIRNQHDTIWVSIPKAVMNADTLNYPNGKPFSYHTILPDGRLSNFKTFLLRPRSTLFGIAPAEHTSGKLEVWFQGYLWREE